MDVLSIVLGVSTAFSGGCTVFMWLGSRSEGARHKRAAETAAQLACSRRAVSGHAWEIYKKLQVHTRQELLLKFRKPGG